MAIRLTTSGDFHVNKEYPYTFIGSPAAGLVFLGKAGNGTFDRASGDFVQQTDKTAIMTVRFRAAAPGDVKVAGKYKLSVCSSSQCQVEQQRVELEVPVM